MAEEDDKANKTEEPSERKLAKAREKGDVPSSREAGNMMSVFSLFLVAIFFLPQLGPTLAGILRRIFENAGQVQIGEGLQGMRDVSQVTTELAGGLATLLGPVAATMIFAAVAGILIAGETVVAAERIKPQFSKLNPLKGLKKIFSVDALVEFLKNVTKVLIVATIAYFIARNAVQGIWQAEGLLPEAILPYLAQHASILLIIVVIFLVVISIADVIWKRAQWMKKQRMSIKEIKDEQKDVEGDPHVKAKRAELRRKRARQRISAAVPTATVVLTNPTHFAVALRYETGEDAAPVCVAKGADLMAAQIRKLARDNDIPIIENKPLARALYDVAEMDEEIPFDHWQAVAEIIGFIMDMKRNIRRTPPDGSSLRLYD